MDKFYIKNPNMPRGFEEVTEEQILSLFGDDTTRPYATQVYVGALSIDDVPKEIRETVSEIVKNKIEKWGEYFLLKGTDAQT